MAYEFVEAFSSVVPSVRVSQILAVIAVIIDVGWRLSTKNYFQPSFVDVPVALLVGYYLGKRPKASKGTASRKSKWIRLS